MSSIDRHGNVVNKLRTDAQFAAIVHDEKSNSVASYPTANTVEVHHLRLWSYDRASEVTTLWRYTNLFIIIIIIIIIIIHD